MLVSSFAISQYTPWYYWTLLPEEQMIEIIGEASGETAYHTIIETAGYTRNRRPEEYRTTFRESAYIFDKLQWYGIPEANLVRVPARSELTWNGILGELWEISPGRSKLISYRDNAFQLVEGSQSADIEAPLVWVGSGSSEEVKGVDLEGKIAIGHGNLRTIHSNAILAGAVGAIAISASRNHIDPLQIPQGRVGPVRDPQTGSNLGAGFAFQMNFREGKYLRNRLLRGEEIIAHARVKTSMEPNELQNVEATIPGTDPDEVAVVFSAHIFEGLMKQGANDNKSGGAAILEVARVLHTLIEEGRIPQPRRSIRFFWGPEFSGSRPWVDMNFEEIKHAYCNINLDMVGEWLSLHQSTFSLMRTTFGNAHYVNDVLENYYRFVGEGNKERIHNRRDVYPVPHRIVSPFGADEPFRYSIETHYGSSDHVVFNGFGVQIPGVMMIAWPDLWYHTSGDVADKADPTQLKRAVVIAAAAAYTIANADDDMAVKIAGETAGNATSRLGHQLQIAMEMINHVQDLNDFEEQYKGAVSLIEAHILNEKATLESIYELASSRDAVSDHIESMKISIQTIGQAHLSALGTHMQARARSLNVPAPVIRLTSLEEEAASRIPSYTPGTYKGGPNILNEAMSRVAEDVFERYPVVTRFDRAEAARLVNGQRTLLEIKKMMDAQQAGQTNLQDIVHYFEHLKVAGLVDF